MAEKINLDSLIPREDLAVVEESQRIQPKESISHTDLRADEFFYLNLFKPDFQRETTEWDYKKVATFIESYLNNELIPAIIMWQSSSGKIFIIDGAHRISSLIAWINDDYGDGDISRDCYSGIIPEEQLEIAAKARTYIERTIGSYQVLKKALVNPSRYTEDVVRKARVLSNAAIKVQWVVGSVTIAEKSFFNINQQGEKISKTENMLIKSRNSALCISARAIMRAGGGHKYWDKFNVEYQREIQDISKEIYDIMFIPKLKTPIKTADVPLCGKHNKNSIQLIFSTVDICNSNMIKNKDDLTGDETIKCLKQTRKIIRLVNANHASSLGLHPLVYFYARNGAYRPASFYAFLEFVKELDQKNKKRIFIDNRIAFEKMYRLSDNIIQKIMRDARGAVAARSKIKDYLIYILNAVQNAPNVKIEQLVESANKDKGYNIPIDLIDKEDVFCINNDSLDAADGFSSSVKSQAFIREIIPTLMNCSICGCPLHTNAISYDHVVRRQDGGISEAENAKPTHPYCNTGYKN